MGPAGDDGVVDGEPDGRSFDPGLETGYLRRAPRDHELSPELGAAPFDPGPERYDDRRARKQSKRRQRDQLRARAQPGAGPAGSAAPIASAIGAEPIAQPEPDRPDSESLSVDRGPAGPAPVPPPPQKAEVIPLPRREPLAERLERERRQRERAEHERRARIEQERAERERAEHERVERRRREREEKLRRERQTLRRPARRPAVSKPAEIKPRARVHPGVRGPAVRRRGLIWPTAKAGLAITIVLAAGAAAGSALGLPVPGLDSTAGNESLASSASLFGVDPGTPTGLAHGYVFPLLGPHDFGEKLARFGAPRSGHIHEGQDIFGKTGTPELAVHDGVVVDRGKTSSPDDGGRGNYLVIYSPTDNHSFVYMHMLKPSPVQLGQQVHAGQVVGQLGCSGSCDGPHLHFEVRIGKASLGADTKPIDPLPYLRQWPQSTPG